MTLTLPRGIPSLERMPERELKLELALALYAARKLTLVQAADVADLNLFDFQACLRDRQIPQHCDESDLEKGLLVLRKL
jgi:predicted HTH domain antitoxin